MPSPSPIAIGSVASIVRPTFGAISKSTASEFDEQRYEQELSGGSNLPIDSKLLPTVTFPPYRFLLLNANGSDPWSVCSSAWNELSAHPDLYWPKVPWGSEYAFYWNGSSWVVDSSIVVGVYPYLGSQSYWVMDSTAAAGTIESGSDTPTTIVCQVYNPDLADKHYQLWTVTGRWDYESNSSGTNPSPNPWSLSTDFVQQSSGILHIGDTLVIPPPFFDPLGTIQSPPGPSSYANPPNPDTAWVGWGQSKYLAWA